MNFESIRSTEMYLLDEALARAQTHERLGEAHMAQHRYELTLSRRLSRKAEKAARQARLSLGRAL